LSLVFFCSLPFSDPHCCTHASGGEDGNWSCTEGSLRSVGEELAQAGIPAGVRVGLEGRARGRRLEREVDTVEFTASVDL